MCRGRHEVGFGFDIRFNPRSMPDSECSPQAFYAQPVLDMAQNIGCEQQGTEGLGRAKVGCEVSIRLKAGLCQHLVVFARLHLPLGRGPGRGRLRGGGISAVLDGSGRRWHLWWCVQRRA